MTTPGWGRRAGADQRVTAWAKQLRKAGLEGGMDQLRARAFIDILLGTDSRPPARSPDGTPGQDQDGGPGGGSGPAAPPGPRPPAPAGPLAGLIPPGFAARVTLTVPAITLTGLADRPGELAGIGPVDPEPEANTSDCYRSQVRADPARRAWRTSSVDALLSHMKAFPESGAAPPE